MKDERTLQMEQNFMVLHNEGKTIKEIAAMFDLSTVTVYGRLSDIAKANGVSRESLLERPHPEHILCKKGGGLKRTEPVNTGEVQTLFNEVISGMNELHQKIKTEIKKMREKTNKGERAWTVKLNS